MFQRELATITREPDSDAPAESESKKPDLRRARSFLTEPHPSGFGELLITDVWLPPDPKPAPSDPVDRQVVWKKRQEYRGLRLLHEKPAASFDARTENYWQQVKDALAQSPDAIVDPYTSFVIGLADADYHNMADHRRAVREVRPHLGRARALRPRLSRGGPQ